MSDQTAVVKVLCRIEKLHETANLLAWAVGHRIEVLEPPSDDETTWILILTDLAYNDDEDMILDNFGLNIVGKISGVLSWAVARSDEQAPGAVKNQQDFGSDRPGLEYELVRGLYSLPIPVAIMRRASGKYVWKWQEATGQADTFTSAVMSALTHAMKCYLVARSELIGS